MKAVLEMELVGDNLYAFRRADRQGKIDKQISTMRMIELEKLAPRHAQPWVARITWDPEQGLQRQFLPLSQKDYADANGEGSRGVRGYWILDSGVYEVNQRLNWKQTRRYYIRVDGPTITEISRQEVYRCLQSGRSVSPS